MVRKVAKSSKTANQTSVSEEKSPFTLVLYEVTRAKGVVETKAIPAKSRVLGQTCMAPDPIDWSEKGADGKKHKAKIIKFGSKLFVSTLVQKESCRIPN